MSLRFVPSAQAPRASANPAVLGYLYNNGGLNNQKMALLGLMLTGIRDRKSINLPYIMDKNHSADSDQLVRIDEVFDITGILEFGRRSGLMVLNECPGGERGGWDYFASLSRAIVDVSEGSFAATILNAVACLRPRVVQSPALRQVIDGLAAKAGLETVIQLRIETDWQRHAAALKRKFGDADQSDIGYAGIISKVKRTFPDLRYAYVTSDERFLPVSKFEIRTASRARFGIDLVWKSDFLPPATFAQMTSLELSLIEFEIARRSTRFVGLTTSTFANMLALERYAETRKPVRGHYFFNTRDEVLIERRDNGLGNDDWAVRFEALLQGEGGP